MQSAPWYSVPTTSIACVEHPFIIHNVAKAVDSLGGPLMVAKLVHSSTADQKAFLSLHPYDRMSASLSSGNVHTNSVLLHITVPKRTGRKRKRESAEGFGDLVDLQNSQKFSEGFANGTTQGRVTSTASNASHLFRSLADNVQSYAVETIGVIDQTHRFRGMPDFVYSTASNSFVQKTRDHILPFDYEGSKKFAFNMGKGPKMNEELIPPPFFSPFSLPFNYSYRQNPTVKQTIDTTGKISTINTAINRKIVTERVAFDIPTVPNAPGQTLPPIETLEKDAQDLLKQLEGYMNERPIWTRRALTNRNNTHQWRTMSRTVIPYVGYMFRSGPWREAIVKYGVDPRTHHQYRMFQTMTFQFDIRGKHNNVKALNGSKQLRAKKSNLDGNSHIFDGINMSTDGKVWQVCDIMDPLVRKLLATTQLRKKCHIKGDGWFHNGTWAKARTITKLKMAQIHAGKGPPDDKDFAKIVVLPNILSEDTKALFMLSKDQATSWDLEWIGHIRNSASTPEPGTGARIRQVNVEEPEMPHSEKLAGQWRNQFDPRAETALQDFEASRLQNADYEADAIARDDSDVDNSGTSNDEDDDGDNQEDYLEDDDPEEET
ncbi:tau 95 subunit of transcription factor TFIIIC [Xylographa bjoerkii]|nr:tau 95 subunit of transcription factor TFIIIC [Xylographa bjoerkii]